ncbi:MAG: NGG1p interacting factor NIF3 [Exilibacterium sp.]
MYKFCFYVPETHLESVKHKVFSAGAGKIGDYDRCAWQTRGEGQFRPLPNSDPFLGAHGKDERVVEYKVEMVCEDHLMRAVLAAFKTAHPYEEPAYDIWRLSAEEELSA